MKATIEYAADHSLIYVTFSEGSENLAPHEIVARISAQAISRNVDFILLDFVGIETDLRLEDIVDVRTRCVEQFEKLGRIKIAAAIDGGFLFAVQIMTVMFNAGVRVAVFNDRTEALGWLFNERRDERLGTELF